LFAALKSFTNATPEHPAFEPAAVPDETTGSSLPISPQESGIGQRLQLKRRQPDII